MYRVPGQPSCTAAHTRTDSGTCFRNAHTGGASRRKMEKGTAHRREKESCRASRVAGTCQSSSKECERKERKGRVLVSQSGCSRRAGQAGKANALDTCKQECAAASEA